MKYLPVSRVLGLIRVMVGAGAIVLSGGVASAQDAPPWPTPDYAADTFTGTWFDGHAELAGYEVAYPRYGQLRRGTAVAITVTEDLAWDPRVKHDGPAPQNDKFKVVKLNLVEDFPTGLYDYNLMTSVFIAAEPVKHLPAGAAVKRTFSAQEWCGHAWQQDVWQDAEGRPRPYVRHVVHSYFEGEADIDTKLDAPRDGLPEEALWLWARGLAGPQPADGASIELPLLRSAAVSRLAHRPVAWDRATLTRNAPHATVRHEALGDVSVYTAMVTVERDAGTNQYTGRAIDAQTQRYTFTVEADAPHRILRVQRDDGYDAVLIKATRLPYWHLNDRADTSYLDDIGLSPRAPRTP